jgi:hypothetical protein
MNWTEIKSKIYYWDGSWRDIYILHTNKQDWEKWVNYVNENYRIDSYNGKEDKKENAINFSVIEEKWNGSSDFLSTATVFIDRIQINAHFFIDTEIENDIDPREINSLEDHNRLIKYMTDLSILLDKDVILTPENEQETILIKIGIKNVEVFTKY